MASEKKAKSAAPGRLPEADWTSGRKSTAELPDFTDAELSHGDLDEVDEHLESLFSEEPGLLKRAGDQVVEAIRSARSD
jgi:hypothetical protein